MTVFAATSEGVFRASDGSFSDIEQVLDSGTTRRIRQFSSVEGVFATTEQGLYRSYTEGDSWTECGVPEKNVYSVLATGGSLYAGVRPAAIYRSEDDGETWHELTGLREVSSYENWPTNPHRDVAHVRTLAAHSDIPDRLVAGIEVAGVFVSDDRGETWRECREGLPEADPDAGFRSDDVHHIAMWEPDDWIVSTAAGVLRTLDAGETWTRLSTDDRWYARESLLQGDVLYTAVNRTPPVWDSVDAALFVSTNKGDTLESVPYPNAPNSFIISWTTDGDVTLAGANDGTIFKDRTGEWEQVGYIQIPKSDQGYQGVNSLAVI